MQIRLVLMLIMTSAALSGCFLDGEPSSPAEQQAVRGQNDPQRSEVSAICNQRGLDAISQGKYEDAIFHFEKAIELEPDVGVYYNNLGRAWYFLGRHERALAILNRAMTLSPNDAGVRANIGDAYRQQGKYDEAVRFYHAALELGRSDTAMLSRVNYDLGNLYLKRGEFKSAEYRLDRAISLDPQFNRAILARLILYHMTQRSDLAWREVQTLEKRGFDVKPSLRESIRENVDAGRRQRTFRPGY